LRGQASTVHFGCLLEPRQVSTSENDSKDLELTVRPRVLINALAGTAAEFAGQDLPGRIAKAMADVGLAADLEQVRPQELTGALTKARERDQPVIIAGGDGSVSAAVQVFAGSGIPLGVIPLGTYNLLGHDLGMSTDIEEAVRRLAGARHVQMDLGRMRRRYFHTLAGLGFFSRVARQRARIRERLHKVPGAKVIGAAVAAVKSFTASGNLEVEIDDGRDKRSFRSPALLITNNLFEGADWRRTRLDGGMFELNVARGDVPFPLLRGGLAAVLGSWRQSEDIVSLTGQQFTLCFRRPRLFLSLDGEVKRVRTPLHFELLPRALTVLAAPAAPALSRNASAAQAASGQAT
jgi:diacylglycerol kinase family enzyme